MPETASAPLLPPPLTAVAGPLAEVEAWIRRQLEPDPPNLAPLLAHVARFHGKRLRAAQVLLTGEACGGATPEHRVVAGIVELIHAATLIHDDLLDEAGRRRGLTCVHLEWGAHASVLLGDWIYARAFQRSTELEDPTCSRVLAEATRRVCGGEIQQNLSRGDFDLSREDYVAQIDGKTAALYEAGGRLGAYYAGAGAEWQEACARHGLLAGRAFQIVDDLLDLTGEETVTGKSLGTDLARGKMTLPLILLRERIQGAALDRLRACFGQPGGRGALREPPLAGPWSESVAECRRELDELLQEAARALAPLPPGNAKDALLEVTDFLATRNR